MLGKPEKLYIADIYRENDTLIKAFPLMSPGLVCYTVYT